jgi:protein phosphatase
VPEKAQWAEKGHLFLLADGVGGREGGATASQLVVEEIARRYYADPSPELLTSLQRVIEATNRRLRSARAQPGMPGRMATTIIAGVVTPGRLYVANVGDSRVYLIRQARAHLLTGDHKPRPPSDSEEGTPGNRPAQESNRITRSLGSHDRVGVDTWQIPLGPSDRLLFCSDGLSNFVKQKEIARLASHTDLQRAVNHLVSAAFDNGSGDNITAILVAFDQA